MGLVCQISAKQAESVAKQQQIAEIEGWINHLETAIVNGAKQVAIETKKLKKAKTRTKKEKSEEGNCSRQRLKQGLQTPACHAQR